jgi:hypothetical protein
MRFWQMIGVSIAHSAPNIENFSDIIFISNDDIEHMRIVLRAPPLLSQAKASRVFRFTLFFSIDLLYLELLFCGLFVCFFFFVCIVVVSAELYLFISFSVFFSFLFIWRALSRASLPVDEPVERVWQ